ncbi:hypothetical protein SEA_ALOEVERA_48 [Microbacterium phage AloeVera]|uniref:Uncharacterized protein n=2 Tax=Akonivirus akoni TaxID=2845587 RepID=A0A4D6T9E8_9CAUD|nr:membrane protein [Microbacterium phage Akoni]QCG78333.1 hypothetical protein SEA_AKONI_47 [Microbacterium phage Akoni]QJD51787.1 hypothetical protein SEA_ASHTON_48 [Microbacterium phage Ashton]
MKRLLGFLKNPVFMMWFNGIGAVFFAVLIVPSLILGWISSTEFISVLSIWALTASHLAAWQGAHAEKKQDEQ